MVSADVVTRRVRAAARQQSDPSTRYRRFGAEPLLQSVDGNEEPSPQPNDWDPAEFDGFVHSRASDAETFGCFLD